MSIMSDELSKQLGDRSAWEEYALARFPHVGVNYNDQNWASVVADALAAGTGAFAETGAHLANDLTGNREGDPMGWNAIADWGKATRERNTHDYTPGSARYYASTMAQALPEMGADMAASMGAGALAGLALGPQAAAASSALKGAATASKWGKRALDFYNSEKKLARAARFLTPAAENVPAWAAATATGMGLEGAFEGQRAMDDYIEEAKLNGTYVPGQTENEARNLRWNVFKDNQLLLGGTNALENALIFGKGKGLMNGLKRLAVASGIEGFEEGAQQIIPKAEQGKDWSVTDRDVLESAAIGALMGGGMHLAGRGIRHAFPNAFGDSYDSSDTPNPMTDPARTKERSNDVPLPGNIDYTEADPSDIVNDWLSKQAGFGNVNANVNTPQAQEGQTSQATGNVDLSDVPMQDIEDKGLAKTNNALKGKFRQLYDWAVQSFGKKVEISGGARSPEHNKEVNGSEHSHHLSGNALDVNVSMLSDAERDAFIQKAKEMGFNADGDDFYHDKGSGYHAHLVYKDDGSASQSATGGQREGHANAWAITDVFRKAGYNDEAIAGILGRVQQEHNFETSNVEEHWDTDADGNKVWVGGYGMFQWNGGRTTAFLEWAKQNGKDPQNPTTQAEYALYEAQQKGLTPDKMNKLSAEDAADLWTSDWEVGRPGSERQYAGEWRERLKKGGTAPTISTQDFSNILGNHMIDFAGSEDDNLTNSYQRIMDNLDNDTKSILSNKFANMYNDDGTFNNTAENRQALAQDEQTAELIRSMAEVAAPQIVAPMVDKNGRISKQAVKDYFTPQIAGVNMHFLKDAIKNDKLNDAEKVAVLQAANIQINIPQPQKSDTEQAKYVNDLQKAIDSRDFGKIYSLMPQATAKAVSAVRQQEPTAQPAAAVVTPEQVQQTPIQEQPSVPVEQPQEVQQEQPTEQIQPVEQYNSATSQNAPQPVQATPTPQVLPSVPTEQENAQTAQQVANKAQQIANVQGQDFNTRLAELQAMPLGQLEQLGQQTLNAMQTAGLPVNESLANGLAAGQENAIALAESKLAEAGVANNATTTMEQVQPDVASQATKAIKQFREKAAKLIEQYRDDKVTYEEAISKLEEMYITADNSAKTKVEHDAAAQTFLSAGENLEHVRQEKESEPQNRDYSNMSLDELKAERQRLIDEEVERMNRNPGGKGTNNGYTYNDRGEITGRYGESLNPQWYQDAYAELGRKPRKKEYPDIALKNLQKHQEFAELEDAIAAKEKESANNELSTEQTEEKQTEGNKEATPETENPFGDLDETFADLAKQAGITPIEQEKAEPKAKSTTKKKAKKKRNMGLSDTSKEREEELKKQLSDALKKSRNRLNSTPVIFDPDVIVPAFNLGRLYVQRGAENFAEYARDMINAVGDSVRGWLRPVWEMIENYPDGKNIDESLVIPAFRYVGSFMHSKPQATYDEVRADFVKRAGEDTAARFDDLLKLAYSGAYKFYNGNEEVTDNELNDSTGQDSARDSEGDNQNEVGADDGSGRPGIGGGRGVSSTETGVRTHGSSNIRGGSSTRSGKESNSGVQKETPGNRSNSTGSQHNTGSSADNVAGEPISDDGRSGQGIAPAKNRPDNAGNRGNKTEAVKVNKDSFKAGDRAQIAGSMPFLMKEQVDDVVKADTRLYANDGEGMMFTNGTGTGKTFTGLGCIKRAVQQGKKNILIIAPNESTKNAWITAGKGFFGLEITELKDTKDKGEGIVITSYKNVSDNNNLVKRDWDMIVADESHKLMRSEKGNNTKALENVRAMTYHADGLRERFERLHAKEYDRLAELRGKASDKEHPISTAEKEELEKLQAKLIKEQEKAVAEWKQIPQADKPKVLFLSATPFSHVPDIDYAEGYLFHYDRKKNQNGGYNQPNAYDDFMIKHFGYRMRIGKLTKPDADVNSDLMEINFNKWLKDQGVLSGRKLKVDKDYERGYILVDGGVGKQIDEGMKIATEWGVSDSDQKYGKLHDLFENKLKGNKTRYLLEAIKANGAVDLIKQYVKSGKKVVVFHGLNQSKAENPFVLTDEDFKGMDEVDRNTARQQYARFCKDHPELLNLNLDELPSPIERLTAEFGDTVRTYNGTVSKKKKNEAVREFNDDASKVKIILCQRDSAAEGISFHDTTGKHQRVLIDLGLPTKPTDMIQCEGRIYRTGVVTDAIIRYLNTGTDMEKRAFASTIASRASTAENLSMGEEARALRNAIVEGFMESIDGDSWKKYLPNSKTEGKGGKERDAKLMDGVSPYEAAKSDYFANQKKNSRNKAQEGIDYFPTPEPIGFKMVEWLGLKPGDRALEPSAGHGAISRYFGAETRNTIVEPSPELATLAKMRLNGGETAKVVEGRFEDLDIHNKYEGIVMNPPYGVGGKTAYEHVAKAFDHLAEGGRMIAIVPDGPAANKRLENWFYNDKDKELNKAVLMGEIKLPQVAFNRAGTKVATKILVIDKYSDEADRGKAEVEKKGLIDLTAINDINELFDRMENMTFPERVGADIPRHFATTVNKAGGEVLTQVAMPDNLELLKDDRLRQMAGNFKGRVDTKYGGFKFKYDEHRAKFIRAANRYLAGKEELSEEQQEIIDDTLTPAETEHFKGGDYKDADGTSKPQAAIKGNLKYNLYQEVKKIALQNNGSYSKGARGFVFDNVADRDNFLKKAEAFFSEKASYSAAPGKTMTTDELNKLWNDTAEVVSEDKLTTQEKELQSIAQSMGAQLEFVTCSSRIQGKYDPATGISYINRNAAHNSAPWIAWHEMFHWIKRNNETLFNKLVEHIKTKAPFSKAQLDKYREAIGRPDISDKVVIEEMMADAFPDVRKRVPFFRELAKENVSLYKRLVAFVKRVMDNIVSRFRAASMAGRGLDFQQIAEMHNAFCNMVRDIRGADGKPIFKVSKDGYREITDMDGNTTEQILEAFSLAETENNLNSAKYSVDNHISLGHNRLKKRVGYEGELTNTVTFDDNGYPQVDVLFEFSPNEEHDYTVERRKQELHFIDGKIDGDPKKALLKILGERKAECDNKMKTKSPNEVEKEYRNRFNQIIETYPVGQTPEEEGRVIAALAMIEGGIEYVKKSPGYISTRDSRFSVWTRENNGNPRGNKSRGGSLRPTDGRYGLEQANNQTVNSDTKHSDNQGAFSVAPVEAPGSMERIKNATKKLLGLPEKLEGNVQDRHTAKINKRNSLDDSLDWNWWMHTMQYLAGKNEAIKRMYYLGKRCMDEQEHLRNEFTEVVIKINKLVADPKERRDLWALLWAGDAEKKEYTTEELREADFSDNVITAYRLVRDNLAKAYKLVNEARMQVKVRNKTMKASELPEFMKEHFISPEDIISKQEIGGGKIVVTYRGAKVYERLSKTVDDELLKQYEADDNIVITDKRELGEGVYEVTYNERPKPMAKLEGYMPHFFHRFMVYESRKDEAGNEIKVSVGSAESLAGATKIANEIAKKNPDKEFFIDTHGFTNGDENNGVVIGDLNFESMTKQLAENTKMSLKEANKFLHDNAGATLKNRHRFFGNMMKRTGAEGFDKNMMWALEHYFNSAARYVAMEHFKPDAISWYERFFGDFNADPETIKGENKRTTARICRQYIMDVNGNPRWLEQQLNKMIDRTPVLGQWLNDTYNGRPALAISSNMSGAMAVAKLGLLNVSSAMLNFMQFINIVTMLDSGKYAKMGLTKALNPSELDQLILDRSGIMDEINMASDAGGYTQTRDYGGVRKGWAKVKWAANKSMFLFNKADALMRKAAVLGAYYQGVQEKGMKQDNGQTISAEALEYAREVNSEANFDYSAANTPAMIRAGSVVTQQLFQFQKYPIMQYEFVKKHVVNGTNSQRVKFLMPYFLLTGLPGMIPFGELLNAFISMFIPGDDDDFAKKMKAELMRWAGNDSTKQAVVNSLTNGPLAAFTGIDISERAGMQNFFAGRYFGNEKPESAWDAVGHALGGATYSTVSGVQKQIHNGNPIEAVKAISPSLGNWLQAAVGETRTTHHRVGSTYDGMYERILHGMGFRHIDETNSQFINNYLYESKKRQQESKKYVMDAYLDDPSEDNRREIILWGISDKELQKYKENQEKSNKDRAAGDEPKKKSKKPKTEAQIEEDKLRQWNK